MDNILKNVVFSERVSNIVEYSKSILINDVEDLKFFNILSKIKIKKTK